MGKHLRSFLGGLLIGAMLFAPAMAPAQIHYSGPSGGSTTFPLAATAADNCTGDTPPYSFTSDANTGICSPAAEQVAVWGNGNGFALFHAGVTSFYDSAYSKFS